MEKAHPLNKKTWHFSLCGEKAGDAADKFLCQDPFKGKEVKKNITRFSSADETVVVYLFVLLFESDLNVLMAHVQENREREVWDYQVSVRRELTEAMTGIKKWLPDEQRWIVSDFFLYFCFYKG